MIVPAHIKPPKHSKLPPLAAAISNMTCRDKRFPPKENIKISPRIPWFLIWKVICKKGSKTLLDQLSHILPWLQRVSWSEMPGKLKHCKSEVLITKILAKKKAMENLVKTTTPSLSLSNVLSPFHDVIYFWNTAPAWGQNETNLWPLNFVLAAPIFRGWRAHKA